MASTNSINTEQSGNMRQKTCLLGLITIAAAFGFVSSPARAQNVTSVDQSSGQYTVQQGVGNSSVNASNQAGIVSQKQAPFTSGVNAANMSQSSSQGTLQSGYGNSAVNASNQAGSISQGNSYQYIPYHGGFNHGEINAADLTQRSGQGVQQSGVGNSAIQAGAQSTSVQQH